MSAEELSHLPAWLRERVVTPREAYEKTVRSGMRIASGLGTSEPSSFYADLWDHVLRRNLTDLDIRQALFMEPHPILVGDALDVPRPDPDAPVRVALDAFADMRALLRLKAHLDELERRRIVFTSAFLGPVQAHMFPDNPATRMLAPQLAGRNRVTAGLTRYQPVHFPHAARSLAFDDRGDPTVDLFVVPTTVPDENGELSFGLSNGVCGDVWRRLSQAESGVVLLYANHQMPFVYGPGHVISMDELRPLAEAGRLWMVIEDAELPGLPPGAYDDPDEVEQTLAQGVIAQVEAGIRDHRGRSLQVGIGRVSAQVVRLLGQSEWTGRGYTEMLDPLTYSLVESGTVTGTHLIESDGRRVARAGIACTFAMGERGQGFERKLHRNRHVVMVSAERLLQESAFAGGFGINNILGIDFVGNVNATAKGRHPYSGIGGLAVIMRGLAKDGIAYLCMKSTYTGSDGKRRSTIVPALPAGTPVSLTAPDILGTQGGKIYLATEHGVVELSGNPLDTYIRRLISVADPEFREGLAKRAYADFRVKV